MRLLHLADLHLDTPFQSREADIRRRLREAALQALTRAVDLALEEGVHVVLLAGDLFDGRVLTVSTEHHLLRELRRLEEAAVPVVYVTGNHDPGGARGRVQEIDWPGNVTVIARATPRRVEIRDAGGQAVGVVVGAGHESSRVTEDLSRAFPPPEGDLPHVALLHTQVRGSRSAEEHEPYAPSELEHLRRSGYAYWALGHVHLRQCLSEDPPVHYPGNLQGRNPRETGAKGGLLVDLSDPDSPRVTFHPLAPVRWETLRLDDLEEVGGPDELIPRVREAREAVCGTVSEVEWLFRVVLAGRSPLRSRLREPGALEDLEATLRDELDVLHVEVRAEGLRPPVRVEEHLSRQDLLGETLTLLRRIRSGEESLADEWREELAGVSAGSVHDVEAYVREILEGAEEELLERMLEEEAP